jgi:hypothetical protein
VDVLEHEQRRLLPRDGLDEAADGKEELLAVVDASLGIEPEQDREVRGDLLGTTADGTSAATRSPSFCSPTSGGSLSNIPQSCLTWVEKAK